MNVYIAYRDLVRFNLEMNGTGGNPSNSDFRLTTVKDDIFLLTCGGDDYAVANETAEKFIDEVLSKCTGKHRGFFPTESYLNSMSTAAVVEKEENHITYYYDMDDKVLLQMLEDLKSKSGAPLTRRELINYCYPNPELPDDFELNSITHQIYPGPDNTPVSVIRTHFPDKKTSCFTVSDGVASVKIRDDDSTKLYDVPAELIPEITGKVRELCKEPAEAYVEKGAWESFIEFDKKSKRIFTDPDKTIALLNDIASKSIFRSSEVIDKEKYHPADLSENGFIGMVNNNVNNTAFFSGVPGVFPMSKQSQQAVQPSPDNSTVCPFCGAPRGTGRFCTECGGQLIQ